MGRFYVFRNDEEEKLKEKILVFLAVFFLSSSSFVELIERRKRATTNRDI